MTPPPPESHLPAGSAENERLPDAAQPAIDKVNDTDGRVLALMRCVLSLSALAVILVDPSEPARLFALSHAALALYCAYNLVLFAASYRSGWPPPDRFAHWADAVFFTVLLVLTDGTSSIFFPFYYFAILVASHYQGFREGMLVTTACFMMFTAVGLISSPAAPDFELNRTLIRAVYLLVLGYMLAAWGGYEIRLKRRLRLLEEINAKWSPRFGADHTLGANLDRLLDFFEGGLCVLLLVRPAVPPRHVMYSASPQKPGNAAKPNEIAASAAGELLHLPATVGALYHAPVRSLWRRRGDHVAYDVDTRVRSRAYRAQCAAIANLLDTRAFITVPYRQRDGTQGRIFLTCDSGRLDQSDIEFLAQASAAVSTVVENMNLVEELVSRATEDERLRISRDLHDTTIQPYIGLKLALEALRRDAGDQHPLAQRLADLAEMTDMTVRDVRGYAASLKDRSATPGASLEAAIARLAQRLDRFYGLHVDVEVDISKGLSDRRAADVFQILSEALSNVLRHTSSRRAKVSVRCDESALVLDIANETPGGEGGPAVFMPRSIQERTQSLGGTVEVRRNSDAYTVVHVTIPL